MERWKRRIALSAGIVAVSIGGVLLIHQLKRPELSFRGYNVAIVSIDTLRADHLGCYGYTRDTSPTLSSLASRSLRFQNAYSTAPWTFPAHFSLFTGHYPTRREFFTYPSNPQSRAGWDHYVTLAEVLKQAGYQTIGASGGAWVDSRFGFAQGFDAYFSYGLRFNDNKQALFGWIDRYAASRPFFLFVHGYDVHRPYDPPDDLKRRFIDRIPEDCRGVTFENVEFNKDRCLRTRAGEEYAIAQYDAEILGVDRFLAELLSRLDRQGLLARTILVVLSDHGEEFWDHDGTDHINTLYEELVRIPLVLHIPGAPSRVVQDPVSILDLMPTVIDLLELENIAPPMQGRSWIPLLEGRAEGRVIHTMTSRDDPWAHQNGGAFTLFGVRRGGQMLIQRRAPGARSSAELFDLDLDPLEKDNVAGRAEYRRRRSELNAELDQWMKAARIEHAVNADREYEAIKSQEIKESLRALGYIE